MFATRRSRKFFSPRGATRRVGLLAAACLLGSALLAGSAFAAQLPVSLGAADGFGVLAGSTVTNAGFSTVNGDLGVSPGTAVTGFPPGTVNGTIHAADPVAAAAQGDLTAAYNDAAGRTPPNALPADVGGQTLIPGVYKGGAALGLTGTVTLDGQGDPNAVFVFQVGSALTTAVGSRVNLINGAQASNVFWQIGSSATLDTSTDFAGTIMALSSISMNDSVTLNGRALARNGAVTLINDTINVPHPMQIPPPPPPPMPQPCGLGAVRPAIAEPPITAAADTDAWRRQYAIAQRTMFGLPTSAQSIAAAAADAAANSDDLGTPLTVAERNQLLAAEQTGQNVEAVSQAAQAALPASFAGAWYDYADGGTMYVAFGPQACPDQGLLMRLTRLAGVRVAAVAAATGTTQTRLEALQAAVERDADMLGSGGVIINRTEIDVPGDRFVVTLDPASVPGAQALMRARYGSQGLAFAPAAPPAKAAAANVRNNPPKAKVHGGQNITDGNGRCTANISMKTTSDRWYVMTAGHCYRKGTDVSQNGSNTNLFRYTRSKGIGKAQTTPVRKNATTNCDCEAIGPIKKSRTSNGVLVNRNKVFNFGFVASSKKYFTGSPAACESGVSEYQRYGQILCGKVDRTSVSERIAAEGFTYRVRDMIHVNYAGDANPIGGDSGGPTGSGRGLLGLVTDDGGDSSKAKNMSDIYRGAKWIVPSR